MNDSLKPNPTQQDGSHDDLESILTAEEQASAAPKISPVVIEQQAGTNTISARKDNPYTDQQLKPGQVIGYGIPTDQKVQIPIAEAKKELSKKSKRRVLYALVVLAVVAIVGGLAFLMYRVATSS